MTTTPRNSRPLRPNLPPPRRSVGTRLYAVARSTVVTMALPMVLPMALLVACGPRRGDARMDAGIDPTADPALRVSQSGERAGRLAPDRRVLVALGGRADVVTVTATGAWRVDEPGNPRGFVRGKGGEPWRVERQGRLLRLAGDGGDNTPWRSGSLIARPSGAGVLVRIGGTRYRGDIIFSATDTGILVVNQLPVEEYLRGVVPLELPTRRPSDVAALEAQAIAARSYSYQRVPASGPPPSAGWHVTATQQHQVYGGVDAEHPVVDAAVAATAGLVLQYAGRLVDAPYSASCGGRTAGPREAWRDARESPYLRPVDDTDPRTGNAYCDISPRNQWTTEFDQTQLGEIVSRALRSEGQVMQTVANGGRAPRMRSFAIGDRTPSGRAAAIVLRTDAGDVTISARDIRPLLRDARGAALPSTYFSVVREARAGGRLSGLTLRGVGHGHGVGMCQWGAIGRARAGADARTILRHYYPGTVVGFAD